MRAAPAREAGRERVRGALLLTDCWHNGRSDIMQDIMDVTDIAFPRVKDTEQIILINIPLEDHIIDPRPDD